jgi:aspartyl-tRNA(Asn)/glutamyl-tRNA(Gln) amidotransferase subunit B
LIHYEPVIGLEVHAQIHTESKMFCGCPVVEDTGDLEPNTYVCPVCAAMPGVLPVVNWRAVEIAIQTGLALHCDIPPLHRFARKSYFYPDLPKGYQISQYALPIAVDGYLAFTLLFEGNDLERRVRIHRAHLEEDAGKLYHENGVTKVDLNRAGVPLLEIVSEPDLRSATEARAYAETLRDVLVYLGVNSGNMERGVMRFEANVSVRPVGSDELGARHEVKNLNSFRALHDSISYEIDHQIAVLESGGIVEQQTMGWNEVDGVTVPQRGKEFAQDYRYFPEPDIPPLEIGREKVKELQSRLPELPRARQSRFIAQYGLSAYDAELLLGDRSVADYFERTVEAGAAPKEAANWITSEIFRLMKATDRSIDAIEVSPKALAELITLVEEGTINQSTGKEVLEEMVASGRDAEDIVAEQGLAQISDARRLQEIVTQVLDQHPEQVQEYLSGKKQVIGWFIGRIMRATRGKANPQLARDLLENQLETRRG